MIPRWSKQPWHCPICHEGAGKCCYRCENNWTSTSADNSAYVRALLDLRDPEFAARLNKTFDMITDQQEAS